jgi:hypothetical protein
MPFFLLLVPLFAMGCLPQSALVSFEENGKFGYRDRHGIVVIQPRYDLAQEFLAGGIAAVVDGSGWAYINIKGEVVVRPFLFDNGPDPFREGLARFKVGAKLGFFDDAGRIAIRPQFDFAFPFSEGLAAFCAGCRERREGEHARMEGGKWGFINKKGNFIIAPGFDAAESFTQGKARVELGGESFYIDRGGRRVKDRYPAELQISP